MTLPLDYVSIELIEVQFWYYFITIQMVFFVISFIVPFIQ